MKPGAVTSDGFSSYAIKPGKAALCWVKGKDLLDVISNTDRLIGQAFEEAGLRKSSAWIIELYNSQRSETPDENGEITVDWYIQVE